MYEHALTKSTFNQPGFPRPDRNRVAGKGIPVHCDCTENLLLTCKAVYLETYLLPLRLNPLQVPWYDGSVPHGPKVRLSWQFASIQSFDITPEPAMMESECLFDFFLLPTTWQPEAWHKVAFVAPYACLEHTMGGSSQSCNFTLLPTKRQDDKIRLRAALEDMHLLYRFQA